MRHARRPGPTYFFNFARNVTAAPTENALMEDSDLTIEILKSIRDGVRDTNARIDETNARLDQTNARLDGRSLGSTNRPSASIVGSPSPRCDRRPPSSP